MKELELEHQYQLYLKRVGMDETRMSPVQRQETKRAFFGACGIMLLLFRDILGPMEDEDKAVLHMEDLINQVSIYWQAQLN